jgi:hypothetical protein
MAATGSCSLGVDNQVRAALFRKRQTLWVLFRKSAVQIQAEDFSDRDKCFPSGHAKMEQFAQGINGYGSPAALYYDS